MKLSDFLRAVPGLADLPYKDLEHLEQSMRVGQFPDGHEFIREGEKANDIYLLVDGEVSVSHRKSGSGEPREIERLHPGEFFGLVALIDHGRRAASCTALGQVRVASLPYTAFSLIYNSNSRLGHAFLRIAADQLTRDFRKLMGLVRGAMFASDGGEAEHAARNLISAYGSPGCRPGDAG